MKKYFAVLALAALFASCDKDDDNNNNDVNATDRDFVMKASMGNSAEVDAGQLASTKAGNAGVMDFGQMMVTDHTNAQAELKMIAGDLNVNAPDSIDAEHMAMKQQLMMMSGMAFDSAYINGQVKDHEATISLFENEANSGNNSRLRDYANNTLPTLRMHKQKADSLAALFP